jgi:hypothetical protein
VEVEVEVEVEAGDGDGECQRRQWKTVEVVARPNCWFACLDYAYLEGATSSTRSCRNPSPYHEPDHIRRHKVPLNAPNVYKEQSGDSAPE